MIDASTTPSAFVLTLSCTDRVGIVAAVSGNLAEKGAFILDSQQYADLDAGRFFMRVYFTSGGEGFPESAETLRKGFQPVAARFAMEWNLRDMAERPRLLLAVSKGSHCLNDLLYRWRVGSLPVDIAGVVSNHEVLHDLTNWYGLDFHYLPVGPDNRAEQEARLLSLMEESRADYLILARYMQILSGELVDALEGRCINIHHSFLPSFKGARPYLRAHERGVKLIGATAHFVTRDLDEGPIIEQDVERVDHRATETDMIRIGRDIEARVLARAVGWAAEHRVFLNGKRTVVFR